ncbi:hypothetical protein CAAN3_03S02608 [[Candida] anglica]
MSGSQRKRQRVPISCLVCKRRKVKCDKARPACGGCVRNKVQHLCEYLDPHWSQEDSLNTSNKKGKDISSVNLSTQSSTPTGVNIILQKQRREIDDLKRKLAIALQTTTKDYSNVLTNGEGVNKTLITALSKLGGSKKPCLEFEDGISITVIKSQRREFIDIYSWVNSLKLDPQLAGLWFKITNLQKIYYTHKMNSLRPQSISPDNYNQNNQLAMKCPVVQYDINTMAQNSPTATPTPIPESTSKARVEEKSDLNVYDHLSTNGATVLKSIQLLWNSTLKISREEVLNYEQIQFLIDYYFETSESRRLTLFHRKHILSHILKMDDRVVLNNDMDKASSNSDESLFSKLKMKGVYLSMLALLVEEAIERLRREAFSTDLDQVHTSSPKIDHFKRIFPAEVLLAPLGPKESLVKNRVHKFLTETLSMRLADNDPEVTHTLPFFACSVLFMNNTIHYKSENSKVPRPFAEVFALFLSRVLAPDSVDIWTDPNILKIHNGDATRLQELQIHMCFLWSNTICLVNLVTFSIVPLVRINDTMGNYLIQILNLIEKSETNQYHTRFLDTLSIEKTLEVPLEVNQLISRIINTLARGTNEMVVTIDTLQRLSSECGVWVSHNSEKLDGFQSLRIVESQITLLYLRFFLSYLQMLQFEENSKQGETYKFCTSSILKLCTLLKYLRDVTTSSNKLPCSLYRLQIVNEVLTRMVSPVSGILLRLASTSASEISLEVVSNLNETLDQQFPDDCAHAGEIGNKIISVVSSSITILREAVENRDERTHMLSKIWNFYLVFIKNFNKISYSSYEKIHANVPAFSSFKRQDGGANKCPVRNLNKTNITSTTSEKKCPVDHVSLQGNCPIDHSALSGKCPVDYKSLDKDSLGKCPIDISKRKCPFDHEALVNRGGRVGAKESHVRGQDNKAGLLSPVPIHAVSPIPENNTRLPNLAVLLPADTGISKVENSLPGILNDFAELNFDMDTDFDFLMSDFSSAAN